MISRYPRTTFPKQKLLPLVLLLLAVLPGCDLNFETIKTLPENESSTLKAFEEIAIEGGHDNRWTEKFHPFIGAAAIDIDGNGTMEIFVGGGDNQNDSLYSYQDNKLKDIIRKTRLSDPSSTHGATAIDMDKDGDTDLLVARTEGVFLYLNNGRGLFEKQQIPVNLPTHSIPMNIAVSDIDKDGDGDLYISVFVDYAHFRSATYNDLEHAKTNVMLRNNGDLTFTDITKSSGSASLQNTFLSTFIDLDDDGWQDLLVAQNTGQVEVFRNQRDSTFSRRNLATGWGFWMGIAAGDIDKDGDQDLFFSNTGTTIPAFVLELAGDGTDDQPREYGWSLFRNDNDFNFTNITEEYQMDGYGFGWGAAFEDLTLDGELELIVAQNYIKWPLHDFQKMAGKFLVRSGAAFYQADELGLENRAFGQAPLIVDINHDGRPDVFWVNMEGKGRAYLNRSPNHFIALAFSDNVTSLGARVLIKTRNQQSYTRQVLSNTGMSTDSMSMLTFGFGASTPEIEQIQVEWLDGKTQVFDYPPIDQIIHIAR